jgi:DNA-binding LytR/AlgR family response regulator
MANYAIKGYAVDALDFVHEACLLFRFFATAEEGLVKIYPAVPVIILPCPSRMAWQKLKQNRILYLESFGHKFVLYTDGEEYSFNDSMKNMEKTLGDHGFYRSNNCYLINLAHVRGVQGNIAVVAGRQLTISRARKKGLMQALSNFIGANS